MKRLRFACALAVAAVVGPFGAGCTPDSPRSGPVEKTEGESVAVEVNSPAPAFAARTLTGDTERLATYVGSHVVLLEFWSIFCRSCIEEMPLIEDLHARYAADGLQVLSINTDVFSAEKVASTLRKAGISPPYPVLRDPRQEIVEAYGVELLPVTVIIDRAGWIRLYQEGYRPGDEGAFEARIGRLLGQGAGRDVTLAPRGGKTAFAPAGIRLAQEGTVLRGLGGRDLDGVAREFTRGSPHLFFFWSLYCKPCRGEYPAVAALARRYAARGLATYSVNVDSARMAARVERFVRAHSDLPCLLDGPEQDDGNLAQALGVRATPTVVLVDAEGRVSYAESGSTDLGALEGRIDAVLGLE